MRVAVSTALIVYLLTMGVQSWAITHGAKSSCAMIFSRTDLRQPVSEDWSDLARKQIHGFESLSEQQKGAIYRLFSTFPKYARRLADLGAQVYILGDRQSLTDLPFMTYAKGKTVADLNPSHAGTKSGERKFDLLRSLTGGKALFILGHERLPTGDQGSYHLFFHEYAHLIHRNLLTEEQNRTVDTLYAQAKEKNRFLDSYSSINAAEYLAQGFEALLSKSKKFIAADADRVAASNWPSEMPRESILDSSKSTREDLRKTDPDLYEFLLTLVSENRVDPTGLTPR